MGDVFHSVDEDGNKTDAHLHRPILAAGDHRRAVQTWATASDHGLDDPTLLALYGHQALPHLNLTPVNHNPFAAPTHKPSPKPNAAMSRGLRILAPTPSPMHESAEWLRQFEQGANSPHYELRKISAQSSAVAEAERALARFGSYRTQHGDDAAKELFGALPLEKQHKLLTTQVHTPEAFAAQQAHLTDSLHRMSADPDFHRRWLALQRGERLPNVVHSFPGAPPVAPSPLQRAASAPAPFGRTVNEGTEQYRRLLQDYLGLKPEEFAGKLISHDDGQIEFNGKLVQGGKYVGKIHQEFDPRSGVAEHHLLEMNPDQTGTGLASKIFARNVDYYKRNGIHTVSLYANIDVGGYFWAKNGVKPYPSEWDEVRSGYVREDKTNEPGLLAKVDRLHKYYGLPKAIRDQIAELIADNDPTALWNIADLKYPTPFDPNNVPLGRKHGEREWLSRKSAGQPLGKTLLLGSLWRGNMDLEDSETMARFNDYNAHLAAKKGR